MHQIVNSMSLIENTYTLPTGVEILALQLGEHFQKLLHKSYKLCSEIIFILKENNVVRVAEYTNE